MSRCKDCNHDSTYHTPGTGGTCQYDSCTCQVYVTRKLVYCDDCNKRFPASDMAPVESVMCQDCYAKPGDAL